MGVGQHTTHHSRSVPAPTIHRYPKVSPHTQTAQCSIERSPTARNRHNCAGARAGAPPRRNPVRPGWVLQLHTHVCKRNGLAGTQKGRVRVMHTQNTLREATSRTRVRTALLPSLPSSDRTVCSTTSLPEPLPGHVCGRCVVSYLRSSPSAMSDARARSDLETCKLRAHPIATAPIPMSSTRVCTRVEEFPALHLKWSRPGQSGLSCRTASGWR